MQNKNGTNSEFRSNYQVAYPTEKELLSRIAKESIQTLHNLIIGYL